MFEGTWHVSCDRLDDYHDDDDDDDCIIVLIPKEAWLYYTRTFMRYLFRAPFPLIVKPTASPQRVLACI